MNSPFPYDRLSSPKEFFGRDIELKKLTQIVKYSNNLLIHSKRRMGKSSLIKNFFATNDEQLLSIYVDIFDITSKEDFALSLLKALSSTQKMDIKSAINNLTSLFKRVRVEPTIDPKTLEVSIKPIVVTLTFEQMMDDFFTAVDKLSKISKVVIAIDEFQQIASIVDVKLDAYLRKYIQNRGEVSYIFLGSKRHTLTSLFQYKAPLFELATHFELTPLKVEDIYNYAKQYIDISKDIVKYIHELSNGETNLIQNILHLLYIYKISNINKDSVDDILKEIIASKDASFRILFDTLNNNQKIALKVIGKYKKGFFALDVLNELNIKKQTLQSAINTLFKKEIVDKNGDEYFIPGRAFEIWVENL